MTSYGTPPPPGWSPHGWARPQPEPLRHPPVRPSRLPVVAVVMAAAALFLALAAAVAVIAGGGGGARPLTGQLSEVRAGSALAGSALETEIAEVVEDDGGFVDRMTCPDTAEVSQGVVTVCHGSIEGEDWAVVVFFEDATGRVTLLPV